MVILPVSSMVEHSTDNRATKDRNLYRQPKIIGSFQQKLTKFLLFRNLKVDPAYFALFKPRLILKSENGETNNALILESWPSG